jgi:hypothetical protein
VKFASVARGNRDQTQYNTLKEQWLTQNKQSTQTSQEPSLKELSS